MIPVARHIPKQIFVSFARYLNYHGLVHARPGVPGDGRGRRGKLPRPHTTDLRSFTGRRKDSSEAVEAFAPQPGSCLHWNNADARSDSVRPVVFVYSRDVRKNYCQDRFRLEDLTHPT